MGSGLTFYPSTLLGITDDRVELVQSFLTGHDYKSIEYSFYQFSPEYIPGAFICMPPALVVIPVIQAGIPGLSGCGDGKHAPVVIFDSPDRVVIELHQFHRG